MPRLFVELFVHDVARSRDFYISALGFVVSQDHPDYVELHRGPVEVCVRPVRELTDDRRDDYPAAPVGNRLELVLQVEDLDSDYARATRAGAGILAGITQRPWGHRDFRLFGPDSEYWRLTSPAGKK